ncbi:MAG: twin-arginine translocation signal domain-containing protein, partial [Planctomycetes bacterium]|nr:twin-arginine translocation signal domain-containing protein [Planctomycetota bacterium]
MSRNLSSLAAPPPLTFRRRSSILLQRGDTPQEDMSMKRSLTRRQFVATTAAAAAAAASAAEPAAKAPDTSKILNYNPDMEYRRCGKTGLMVSAIALGGHWKRVVKIIGGSEPRGWMSTDIGNEAFQKNRWDVMTRCIEKGINYVDACCGEEILAYSRALKGRRDKMYFGFSWHVRESRFPEWRSAKKLQEGLDLGL